MLPSITSSAESTSTVTASPTTTTLEAETDTSTIKTNFFEGMKYEHNILENQGQPQQPQQTQRMSGGHHQKTTVVTTEIRPMSKSETARALDELGFEYNEYMDDSELLGDDNNDEVSNNVVICSALVRILELRVLTVLNIQKLRVPNK